MDWMHESLLPWHESLWNGLRAQCEKGGGLLLSGPSGHGKRHLARHLAQSLLCEAPAEHGHPCGRCASCLLIRANQHPDWVEIVTEQHWDDFVRLRTDPADGEGVSSTSSDKEQKVARDIRIADIRRLDRLTTLSAHRGGRRVVLIWPADEMTTEASNALLKTLEEPGQGLHFILVSAHPAKLLPTVRSRVRVQVCPPAPRESSLKWLKDKGIAQADVALGLCTGAPLNALDLQQGADSDDTVTTRNALIAWLLSPGSRTAQLQRPNEFDRLGLKVVLQLMVLTASEYLRQQHGAPLLHLTQHAQAMGALKDRSHQRQMHELVRDCLAFMPQAEHPLNVRMQLDDWCRRWFDACMPAITRHDTTGSAGRNPTASKPTFARG